MPFDRSPVASVAMQVAFNYGDRKRRQSPGSCGATPPPEAAAWSIAQRQRNGTPSGPLATQSKGSLRSTRHCKPMWRNDWPASLSLQAGPGSRPGRARERPRRGPRQDRRWATAWSPEQIARRLPVDFPDDETMRVSHEAIYQALFVQGRGTLGRDLTACLRSGRVLRMPRARTRGRGKTFVSPEIMISQRPAEAADRAVPGHCEGDLILGLGSSAIGTLVERRTIGMSALVSPVRMAFLREECLRFRAARLRAKTTAQHLVRFRKILPTNGS
jgi:hypothetical protein